MSYQFSTKTVFLLCYGDDFPRWVLCLLIGNPCEHDSIRDPLLWALVFWSFLLYIYMYIYMYNLDVDFFLPKKHFFYFFIEYRHITYHFTQNDLTKKIRNFVFGFEHVGAGRLRPGRGFESRSRPFFGHCTVLTVQWPMRKSSIFFFF